MTGTMKAIVLGKFGGVDAFEMRDVAVPVVGPRQVRVRVHATAINPWIIRFDVATTPTTCRFPPLSDTTSPA